MEEEDLSFASPGSLPLKRNYNGYPLLHPQGHQHYQPPYQGYQHYQPPNKRYQHQPLNQGYQHYQPLNQGYQCNQPPNQGYQCNQPPNQGYQQQPPNHSNHPPTRQEANWMTPEIRAELQVRNRLRGTLQRSTEDRKEYQAQCEKVQLMIDESKAALGIPPAPAHAGSYPPLSHAFRRNYNIKSQQESGSSDSSAAHHSQNQANSYQNSVSFDPYAAYRHSQDPGSCYQHQSQAPGKVHTCGPCNRSYFSKHKFEEHLKEHVECPFPECKLSAHIKVIDQHINNQHLLINFASLQIDDETWIAERKKRFPTVQRAEARRAEQLEKVKRGEKLGKSTKPFNNKITSGKPQRGRTDVQNANKKETNSTNVSGMDNADNNRRKNNLHATQKEESENQGIQQQTGEEKDVKGTPKERRGAGRAAGRGRAWLNRRHGERPAYPPRARLDVDMLESSDDEDKPKPFKGTRHFYESTGEMSFFSISSKKLDVADYADQDMDAESEKTNHICISDEEEWPATESLEEQTTGSNGLVLGGALGSLIGAYSDSEEEEETNPVPIRKEQNKPVPPPTAAAKPACPPDSQGTTTSTVTEESKEGNPRPGPSESSSTERPGRRYRNHRRQKTQKNQKDTAAKVKKPVVPVFKRFRRRRKTLLEKLLMPDIIHERNVILQCVRYIVENHFFDSEQMRQGSDGTGEERTDMKPQGETETVADGEEERSNATQQGKTETVADGGGVEKRNGEMQGQNEPILTGDEEKNDVGQEGVMIKMDTNSDEVWKDTEQQEHMEAVDRDEEQKDIAKQGEVMLTVPCYEKVSEVTKKEEERVASGREEEGDATKQEEAVGTVPTDRVEKETGGQVTDKEMEKVANGEEKGDAPKQEEAMETVDSDAEVSNMTEKDSKVIKNVIGDSEVAENITVDKKAVATGGEEGKLMGRQEKVMGTVASDGEVIEKVEIETERLTGEDEVPEMKMKEVEQATGDSKCLR